MEYKVEYGNYVRRLNNNLIRDDEHFHELEKEYIEIYKCFDILEETNNIPTIIKCNNIIEDSESKIQELFGFEVTRDKHTFWFNNQICSCPHLDNRDEFGSGLRHINPVCKMHGDYITNYQNREKKFIKVLSK